MDFELNEEQKIIQETAAKFAKRELEPVAAEIDRTKNRRRLKANLENLRTRFYGVKRGSQNTAGPALKPSPFPL